MIQNEPSREYADNLSGIWDNMEIYPENRNAISRKKKIRF
jgi:hypothetical protein